MNRLSRLAIRGAVSCLAIVNLTQSAFSQDSADRLLLSDVEVEKIISHGPWPPAQRNDPSNGVSGDPSAIELGKKLFFDTRLSSNGKIACGSCHDPKLGWTDGLARAGGLERLDRNTQSLFNASGNRWFGWDGRNDSLWAHSIGPILDKREMGATPDAVAALLRRDPAFSELYTAAFGSSPDGREPLDLVVDAAKAMAAFQETITSGRTAFDNFRDALRRGDFEAAGTFPASAQRGAALFVGRGKCNFCHLGPRFTNDEFDDVGIPYFTGPGQVDRGRFGGIKKLRASAFNQLGRYNDAPDRASGWATEQVAQNHRTFGQFKVPSLRQLTHTAPYMHNGLLASLEDVVAHYSNISLDRIHADGALILEPLHLTEQESSDLLEFLKSLSNPTTVGSAAQ
ncbi:MAG: cytochrome c peroxidase [Pseudomonadota bacterium]